MVFWTCKYCRRVLGLNNVKSVILKVFPFPFHENKFKMHEGLKYPSLALQIALLILLMGLESVTRTTY